MSETRHTRLLIIGSGPAGYTAAVYGARAMLEPILIQGIQPGGQLTITTEVENWPGDVEVQGPALMERMEAHAKATGAEVIPDHIARLELDKRPFTAIGDGGTVYTADAVILATGAQAKWLGLPSEEAYKGFGVSACATCDGFFFRGREVVVVGGGNSAVEEALFLTNFATKVTLVHRRDELRADKILQERLFRHPKIETIWFHTRRRGAGREDPKGVTGVRLRDIRDGVGARGALRRRLRRDRSRAGVTAGAGPTRDPPRRLRGDEARVDRDLDSRRLRRRRHRRPGLPAGGDLGRDGLHGRARRRALPRGASGAAEVAPRWRRWRVVAAALSCRRTKSPPALCRRRASTAPSSMTISSSKAASRVDVAADDGVGAGVHQRQMALADAAEDERGRP